MICEKRQKVVQRGQTFYRCLNVRCDLHGERVSDEQCAQCPMATVFKKRPCLKIPGPCHECREKERELAAKQPSAPEYPALLMQLMSWKEAVKKWREAGKPVRSDEEVNAILEQHCKACSWYDKDKRRCKGCGCKVTDGGIAVFNKVRMATEHCPRDLW